MSGSSLEAKARLKRALHESSSLEGQVLRDILWACQIATAHEIGTRQLEALVEFLQERRVLRLEGFPEQGQSREVRNVRELAVIVRSLDPAIDVLNLGD